MPDLHFHEGFHDRFSRRKMTQSVSEIMAPIFSTQVGHVFQVEEAIDYSESRPPSSLHVLNDDN